MHDHVSKPLKRPVFKMEDAGVDDPEVYYKIE